MAILRRKTQIGLKHENLAGVAETITQADLLPVLADPAPNFTPDFPMVVRNLAGPSLSKAQGRPSFRSGRISFTVELAGPLDANPATLPLFGRALEACGMKRNAVRVGRTNLVPSTPFINHGDTYTQAVTSATGSLLGRFFDGDSRIFLLPAAGSVNPTGGNLLTFASGTTINPTSFASGHLWQPSSRRVSGIAVSAVTSGPINVGDELFQSASGARGRCVEQINAAGTLKYELFEQSGNFLTGTAVTVVGGSATATPSGGALETQLESPSCTVEVRIDGQLFKIRGARGTVTARFEAGGILLLDFEFLGVAVQPSDSALLAAPTSPALPAILIGTRYQIANAANTDSILPRWGSGQFALGNEIVMVVQPDDPTGFKECVIVDRSPTAQLDPEVVREAVFPLLGQGWDKAAFRNHLVLGTEANDGNSFVLQAPWAQVDAHQLGDRDGSLVQQRTMPLARSQSASGPAADDELIVAAY